MFLTENREKIFPRDSGDVQQINKMELLFLTFSFINQQYTI